MSSTSSSPLPDDSSITEETKSWVRRSTRKKGSVSSSPSNGMEKIPRKKGFVSSSPSNGIEKIPRKKGSVFSSPSKSNGMEKVPRKKVSVSSSPSKSNGMEMLEKWIEHDHHSYHLDFLSPTQAYKIRIALVEWYRANRRKLPWRGDAGPYDGSTIGYAASGTAGGKATGNKKRKEQGNDIRSFFADSSSSGKKKRRAGESKVPSEESGEMQNDSKMDLQAVVSNVPREVTAYGVWVSEIMLQQTRVEAVIPYYLKWMQKFPTVHCLANATDEEVNSHWAGLGFYRRARFLHAGAKRVVNDYNGIVPTTVEELLKVEGIGPYTASAVASIAHGVEVPVVDGNVCRVLSRLTGIANHIKAGVLKDDLGWTLAERIIKAKSGGGGEMDGSPGEVNQALMELGATYCSPAGSGVDDGDPLKEFYVSTRLGMAIGEAMHNSSSSVSGQVESLIANKAFVANEKGDQCRLCDPKGISTAYYDIMDRMNADLSTDSKTNAKRIYAIAGHASLPIPPPKKSKREEVIAVAVISLQPSDSERCWLMVKRPSKGLLAGQWEFPSVCVWNSANDGELKTKKKGEKASGKPAAVEVPLIDPTVRSDALDSFLSDIYPSDGDLPSIDLNKRAQVKDAPVVHIFSHVCHTMWVETLEADGDPSKKWKLDNGQEIGWMTESDMTSVGITSGVRKVLAKASTSQCK
eukprot:CAMPEP_0201944076 /NCGR_PEP_ID=MMETSP0903-20130614/52402_1 /ASSEMBLY_ACC=CAM_ASM_000552 /TAXON_ID=420261 /ORGANISM="Thalassiosira antarctica, Strain CCMP982" /LENGTH=690 /DNA_ID=CAMNT_0048486973 /DNA_START=153 /DNA_END=2222 /DNA_ORIENTATION=+